MAESAKTNISKSIESLKSSVESGSVTPVVVGNILDQLNNFADSVNADLEEFKPKAATGASLNRDRAYVDIRLKGIDGALDAGVARVRIPVVDNELSGVMHPNDFIKLNACVTGVEVPSTAFAAYFNAVFQEGVNESDAINYFPRDPSTRKYITANTSILVKNGYYSSDSDVAKAENRALTGWTALRPYCAYGFWLTEREAMQAVFRPWSINLGGVMPTARVNIPLSTKNSDSHLNLDYCATNSGYIYALALGTNGWDSEIEPLTMYRAFHGASYLRAIIGIIDMQRMSALGDNTFLNSPALDHFQIRNVPDSITQINLSGCGDIFAPNFYQGGTPVQTGKHLSSMEYLRAHYNDDVNRKAPLTVIVREFQLSLWAVSDAWTQLQLWEREDPLFVVSVLEGV